MDDFSLVRSLSASPCQKNRLSAGNDWKSFVSGLLGRVRLFFWDTELARSCFTASALLNPMGALLLHSERAPWSLQHRVSALYDYMSGTQSRRAPASQRARSSALYKERFLPVLFKWHGQRHLTVQLAIATICSWNRTRYDILLLKITIPLITAANSTKKKQVRAASKFDQNTSKIATKKKTLAAFKF